MSSYQVTMKVELYFDVPVEAGSFADAIGRAAEESDGVFRSIIEHTNGLVPDEALADASLDVAGVYKL